MELIERVEIHELDARELIDALAALHPLQVVVKGRKRVGVAIGQRIAQQPSVATDTHEVNAPRVDADALDSHAALGHLAQPADNLVVEREQVPIDVAARFNQVIGKTRQFLYLNSSVADAPQYCTTAGGTKVGGKKIPNVSHAK